MPHNSRKCGPISIILYSQMNCKNIVLDLPPHLKFVAALQCEIECSTLLLYSTLFNANPTQNRLFTVSVYHEMLNSVSCLRRLICNRTTLC